MQSEFTHRFAYFHSLIFYTPFILFSGTLLCDCLYLWLLQRRFLIAAHWMLIIGVIACMPTIFTGIGAMQVEDVNNPFIAKHIFLGYATGISSSCYAGMRIAAMWWRLTFSPKFYVGLSFLLFVLISWTIDYGMLIFYY